MREILQQHSYVFISLGVVVGLVVFLRLLVRLRWRFTLLGAVGLTVLLAVALLVLRPGLSDIDSAQAAESMLHNGRPTFLEFFSNY
jgi:hypothetical protein